MKSLTAILVLIVCFSFSANVDVHLQNSRQEIKGFLFSHTNEAPCCKCGKSLHRFENPCCKNILSISDDHDLSNVSYIDITSLISAFPYLHNRSSMESASFVPVFEQPPEYSLSLLSLPYRNKKF